MQHFLAKTLLLLTTISLFHFITFSKASKPTGFSLKLIPGDSPKSPLYPGNLTTHERMQWLINISQARIHHSRSKTPPNATISNPENIRSTIIRDLFYFAVHATIGNPTWGVYLLMDTGGGLIWTQCQPCIKCFDLIYGIFDPRVSTTYSKLPCDHPLCQGLYKCVNDQCLYDVSYGGWSEQVQGRTKGVASFERFTFLTTEGSPVSIDNITFGCSNYNENFEKHMGFSHNIGGIMGMSLSPDSLVSQLGDRIEKKFSYCIPTMEEKMEHNILLNFGSDVPIPSSNLESTPFVTPEGAHRFYLNLQDISVGSHRMRFPPGTFRVNEDESEGFLIDSGIPLTYLDSDAHGIDVYFEVLAVFQNHYDSHRLTREWNIKPHGFELCYENRPRFEDFLTMTYHFEPHAEYVVHSKDVHFE